MEKNNVSVPGSFADIRYDIFYTAGLFIAALILIVIFLIVKGNWQKHYYDIILILGLLLLIRGINALSSGNKYVRLDKQSKTIKIYDAHMFWAQKYKYDRLFFKGKKLCREIDGKTEYINITGFGCMKNDFKAFVAEVNKGV
jgi:hypothetical protein